MVIGVVGRTGAPAVKLATMASKLDFENATTHHRDIMENSAQALQPRRECVSRSVAILVRVKYPSQYG